MTVSTNGYVRRWAALGLGGVAAATWLLEPGWPGLVVLAMVAVTALADAVEIEFSTGRTTTACSLLEAALAASLLLLSPGDALVATLAGVTVSQVPRSHDGRKLAFNLGQLGLAIATACVVVAVLPAPAGVVTLPAVTEVAFALVAYTGVNILAMGGLIRREAGRRAAAAVRRSAPVLVGTVLASTMVGALGVSQWLVDPRLAVLVVGPLAAVHLGTRGIVRTRELLERLHEDHDRLEHVIAGATDGVAWLEADGVLRVANPALERILGRSAAELTAPGGATDLRDVDGQPLLDDVRGDGDVRDVVVVRPDGREVALRISRSIVRDEDGAAVGTVAMVHDVSAQRELDAMREHFVARVSHELRSPLTPIKGFAEALLHRGDQIDATRRDRALEAIIERADHMTRLVEDLLLATREGGAADVEGLELEPLDLGELVDRAVRWARDEAPGRQVRLELGTGGPAFAEVDRLRTGQVLANLLGNAIKYAPTDEPVDVAVRQADGRVEIVVADRGPGIPADKRETVFEPFQRLEAPMTMRTGGVGLGLHLARQFAVAMGGSLVVEDRAGGGASFVLALPAAATTRLEAVA